MTTAINPAYIEIGKALALQLGQAYAAYNPAVGLGLAAYQTIINTQATIALQSDILAQSQSEGWTETDPRWAAPLAAQQARMDTEDARHAAFKGAAK